MNYFELLDIPQKYDFELQILEQKYFALLSKFHPDRAKSADEKTNFLSSSMEINNAYKTLKDELGRAKHLLLINGIDIDDANIKNKFPAQYLAKIWQDFEFIDDSDNLQELQNFRDQKMTEKQYIVKELIEAFSEKITSAATLSALMLRYTLNIIENVNLKIKNVAN